jgi:hypothetical protein
VLRGGLHHPRALEHARLAARVQRGVARRELDRQIKSTGRLVADLDAEIEPRWEQFLEEQGKALYLALRKRIAAAVKLPPPRGDRDLTMVHD